MISDVKKTDCTGCKACGDICPQKAIDFQIDEEGFWFPNIDVKKCIDCGLCDKVCPIKTKTENTTNYAEPETYASYSKNTDIRFNSTSGGIYYEIARVFVENGGYLAGCIYSDDFRSAKHVVTNDPAMLSKLMGSKYFQSDTESIYTQILNLMKQGYKILFCGTPCQVAALCNYIPESYQTNLFTIDFICRGINSPYVYRCFLEELEKKNESKVINVHFKHKKYSWVNLSTRVELENGFVYCKNKYFDAWVNSFIYGNLHMRKSCFSCQFRKFPRPGDLSFGDFWGMDFTLSEAKQGVSVVLENSNKGKYLIDLIRDSVVLKESTLIKAINGNGALLNNPIYSEKRVDFYKRLKCEQFSTAVWNTIGISKKRRICRYILENTKSKLWLIKNTIKNKACKEQEWL